MQKIENIKSLLKRSCTIKQERLTAFFKTGSGDYAEHDQFIGVTTPVLRSIAKEHSTINFQEIQILIESPINEERLLDLFILVIQYSKNPDGIYKFYMDNLSHVNNWNLVDSSAHLIIGSYLIGNDQTVLIDLAKSKNMWKRRVAIVATWYFIRKNSFHMTLKIASMLVDDKQDLIHKAVGWMLRELGKKDQNLLILFLNEHANKMPRTMLRYAIEKLDEDRRRFYLTSSRKRLNG